MIIFVNLFTTGGDNHLTSIKPTSSTPEVNHQYQNLWPVMKKDLLWTEAKDVWYVHVDPLWAGNIGCVLCFSIQYMLPK